MSEPNDHDLFCPQRGAAAAAVPCFHGRIVCDVCDACTCGANLRRSGARGHPQRCSGSAS